MHHARKSLSAITIAACSLLGVSAASAAGDTHAAWEGFLTFTANPPAACAGIGGVAKGDTHVSLYRPNLGASDTSPTFLAVLFTRAGLDMQSTSESTAHQMNGSGNYTGFALNGKGKAFTYTGGTFTITVSPTPVNAATNAVSITGSVTNVFNTVGCNVAFKATYVKRID